MTTTYYECTTDEIKAMYMLDFVEVKDSVSVEVGDILTYPNMCTPIYTITGVNKVGHTVEAIMSVFARDHVTEIPVVLSLEQVKRIVASPSPIARRLYRITTTT